MVWRLPELPIRWEALPSPLEAGWALIRLWELPEPIMCWPLEGFQQLLTRHWMTGFGW